MTKKELQDKIAGLEKKAENKSLPASAVTALNKMIEGLKKDLGKLEEKPEEKKEEKNHINKKHETLPHKGDIITFEGEKKKVFRIDDSGIELGDPDEKKPNRSMILDGFYMKYILGFTTEMSGNIQYYISPDGSNYKGFDEAFKSLSTTDKAKMKEDTSKFYKETKKPAEIKQKGRKSNREKTLEAIEKNPPTPAPGKKPAMGKSVKEIVKTSDGMSKKSFAERFDELKKEDKAKLKEKCAEILAASEKRKEQAKESTESRESKNPATRVVDTGIKAASAMATMAEKANLSDAKQKQFEALMKQLGQIISAMKSLLGGGAMSKAQKEAFKSATTLED